MKQATKIEYNGHNYLVVPVSYRNYYGVHKIYHVLTNNPKCCAAALPIILGFHEVESKGLHDLNYQRNPSIHTALKPYYEVKFIENNFYERNFDMQAAMEDFNVDTDCFYEFIYIEPYDD